jgi:8-oxo-dGTP pyrophosphatase MutT (NUDIX family)
MMVHRRTSRPLKRNGGAIVQPAKTSKPTVSSKLKGAIDKLVDNVVELGDTVFASVENVPGISGASRVGKASLSDDKYMRAAQILATSVGVGLPAIGIYNLMKKAKRDPKAMVELQQIVEKAATPQLKQNRKTSRAAVHDPALAREFSHLINMSGAQIRAWAKDPRSKDASFPHIRAELPLLAQMKDTPPSRWTPKMWDKAMRAVNFVKRHEAQMKKQGAEYGTGKYHATHKRVVALLNWGRRTPGVNIDKAVGGKQLRANTRWGRVAAGALIVARDTGRVLLTLRSKHVNEPHTWGLPGGRCEEQDGSTLDCAIREAREETSFMGPLSVMDEPVYTYREPDFAFDNYLAFSDSEFKCKLDAENDDYGWFSLGELPEPLHFGVRALLNKAGAKIARHIERGGQV